MSTYGQRLAAAKAYVASCKIKPTVLGQKFPRGTWVHVQKEMPACMRHFESDFDGIVEYSYSQKFGHGWPPEDGREHKYSLIVLDANGQPSNAISWYGESLLTLVDADVVKGLAIILQWQEQGGDE